MTVIYIYAIDEVNETANEIEISVSNVEFETVLKSVINKIPLAHGESIYVIKSVMSIDYKDQIIELECEVG